MSLCARCFGRISHVLAELSGIWRVLAVAGRIVPRSLRDFLYDRVAAVRKRLFRPPDDSCPVAPRS